MGQLQTLHFPAGTRPGTPPGAAPRASARRAERIVLRSRRCGERLIGLSVPGNLCCCVPVPHGYVASLSARWGGFCTPFDPVHCRCSARDAGLFLGPRVRALRCCLSVLQLEKTWAARVETTDTAGPPDPGR